MLSVFPAHGMSEPLVMGLSQGQDKTQRVNHKVPNGPRGKAGERWTTLKQKAESIANAKARNSLGMRAGPLPSRIQTAHNLGRKGNERIGPKRFVALLGAELANLEVWNVATAGLPFLGAR